MESAESDVGYFEINMEFSGKQVELLEEITELGLFLPVVFFSLLSK